MNSNLTYDMAIATFFDNNLKPGMCYGSNGEPFTDVLPNAKLVYQDGTACSASYAFSDVFQLPDSTFIVKTKVASANCTGGNMENDETIEKSCRDLSEVLIGLASYSGHDPNTAGDMLFALLGRDDTHKLLRKNPSKIISLLKGNKEHLSSLVNRSFKYQNNFNEEDIGEEDETGEDLEENE